jgi:serine/threonine protein kinase
MSISDRYDVQGPMGEGGFAHVFRGIERTTGRAVALKVLKSAFHDNPEVRERFQREVFAVASLSNPHIVGMHDFCLNESDVYIAMEFVAGATLREMMNQPLTLADRFLIITQIADAIDAAHERNVVHRDLKPENIKVVERTGGGFDVKVLDFGMAKISQLESQLELRPLTKVGICFGTPHYMSPEQIRGKLDDPSIDLFALTTIAYELIVGARPWDGEDPYEIMRAVLRQPAPRITKLDGVVGDDHVQLERVNAFFDRALAKTREIRPKDARELCKELEDALFAETARPQLASSIYPIEPRLDDTQPHDHSRSVKSMQLFVPAVETDDPEPIIDAELRAQAIAAANAWSAARKKESGLRRILVPLLVIVALGGSLGYFIASSGSSQANHIHDFVMGKK